MSLHRHITFKIREGRLLKFNLQEYESNGTEGNKGTLQILVEKELEGKACSSMTNYGFRPKRSAIDAVEYVLNRSKIGLHPQQSSDR
ncbi:hypothetical protein JTB14_031061 [Gonioctena quinquepunctata]|nr:hypothetical protein JTB14_031061 [Gonioctena quinquepunctata]